MATSYNDTLVNYVATEIGGSIVDVVKEGTVCSFVGLGRIIKSKKEGNMEVIKV